VRPVLGRVLLAVTLWKAATATASDPTSYLVCVSNERSGDVAMLRDRRVVATVPVGKRPRGLHASPDGRWLYVSNEDVATARSSRSSA
jgi:DNA-binding beta-propeller fold protein YncE